VLRIEISNNQALWPVDESRMCEAIRQIVDGEGVTSGSISFAIVDDATIHRLNRQYLNHDYATDVLSFVLEEDGKGHLEGEVIVSAEMAASQAKKYGWSPAEELLLYGVHGTLHLVGYDDTTEETRPQMREREHHYLGLLGVEARYKEVE